MMPVVEDALSLVEVFGGLRERQVLFEDFRDS
jgi:hypothetical protein